MKRISNILSILLLAITFNVASLYAAPSTQAKSIAFTDITSTSATITWINGNGGHRIVVVYNNNSTPQTPTNGTSHTASSVYGSGAQLTNGGTVGYVVYNGTGSTRSVTVTNLVAGTEYFARVYESNNIPTNFNYNTSTALNNPRALKTSVAVPTGLANSLITANTATVSWTAVSGATGYTFDMTTNGNDIAVYNDIDLGNVTTYDLTSLTENTDYDWTVSAYNNDGESAYATRLRLKTLDDTTPPTFTVAYFFDNNYTIPLQTQNGVVGTGTYYLRITSSEPLPTTPTVTINAAGGTINDRTSVATNQISNTTFAYTRVVSNDVNSDNGLAFENISVTGDDGNGNIGTTNNLNGLKIDTKAPELNTFELVNNSTLNVTFTEGVRHANSSFNQSNGVDSPVELTTANFNVQLANATNSGVTAVSVTNVTKNSSSSYTLTLSYTALNVTYGAAPYQGTPALTLTMLNTEDIIGNAMASYTTPNIDLFLTPIKNISKSKFYETIDLAISDAASGNNLLFAPTAIDADNAITTNKNLNFDGFAATTLNLYNDLTFNSNSTVTFSGVQGKYTITALDPFASLEFNTANITLNNLTLNADFNTNGGNGYLLTGTNLTVNSNIGISGNSSPLSKISSSTFTKTTGTAIVITDADLLLENVNFNSNATSIRVTGIDASLDMLNTNITNATTVGIFINNSFVNIDGGSFTNNKTFLTALGSDGYITMYNSTVNGSNIANNNIGFNITNSGLVLDNVDVLNNVTGVNITDSEGGVTITNGSNVSGSTTGISSTNSFVSVDNSTFSNNTTGITQNSGLLEFGVYNTIFTNNMTSLNVTATNNLDVINSSFTNSTNAILANLVNNTMIINTNTFSTVTNAISSTSVKVLYANDNDFGNSNNGVILNTVITSAEVVDNKFTTGRVAITNNSNKTVNAVSNFYGSVNGPTVAGGAGTNPCGNGATINGTGVTNWEPWYYDNTLTTTASNVTNNVASTSTPEYCAYPNSKAQFTGTTPSGGYGGYTYQWFNGVNPIPSSNTQNLTNYTLDVAGTYTITRKVTSNGCTYTSNSVTVIVNPLPNVPTITGTNKFCFESSTTISVSNVQSGITYQWYKGGNIINGATNNTLLINSSLLNGGETANFTVKATSPKTCEVTSNNYSVQRLPEITVSINSGAASYTACRDGISALTTTKTPNGDNFTYQWYNNNVIIPTATGSTYLPTASGTHKVIATNTTTGIGCTNFDEIVVTINELPTTPIISGDVTACFNESVTLSVSNYVAGDLTNFSLTWFNSSNTQVGTGLTHVVNFANIAANSASYYVVATNLITGCDKESAGFPSSYTVNELPEFFVNVENVDYCSNATAVALEAEVTGGTNGDMYSYEWFNEMDQSVGTGSTFTYPTDAPGTYTYYVVATLTTNIEGCKATSNEATIHIYELAEPVISGDNALTNETDRVCEGQDITFTVTNENMDNEAVADSYQWYFEGTPVGTDSPTLEITNAMLDQAGDYTVEITTINGCTTESAPFNLEVTPLSEVTGLTFTTNGVTSNNLTQGQQTDFREDLDITYTVTATDAVSYKWYFEGELLDEETNELTLTYETIDMLDGVADNMYEGTDIFANPINTFTVQAEAVSDFGCINDMSVEVELNVVPVPTWIEIVAIPTRTDDSPANDIDIPSNNTNFTVTVRAKNNLDFLSNVIANTNITMSLNGGTLVTSTFNNNTTITIPNGQSSVSFPVKLVKTVGEIGLTLKAIVDDATTDNDLMDNLKGSDDGVQNMMTDFATSNEFVLIPTKPAVPTTPTRVSRSRTTLTLKSTITNPVGVTLNSLIVAKQSATNPTTNLTPADGQLFTANSVLGNGDVVGDSYFAVYFGSARQVTMSGLTKSTAYSIKYYAVAGDFIAAKTATYRYSDNLKHDGVLTSNKESDEVEFVSESDAPFTVDAVFPNPVKDVLNFNLTNTEAASYKVEVMTATGQIVSVPFTDLQLAAGTSSHNFNLQGVAAGSYMLIVTSGDHAYVVPFVVMP